MVTSIKLETNSRPNVSYDCSKEVAECSLHERLKQQCVVFIGVAIIISRREPNVPTTNLHVCNLHEPICMVHSSEYLPLSFHVDSTQIFTEVMWQLWLIYNSVWLNSDWLTTLKELTWNHAEKNVIFLLSWNNKCLFVDPPPSPKLRPCDLWPRLLFLVVFRSEIQIDELKVWIRHSWASNSKM